MIKLLIFAADSFGLPAIEQLYHDDRFCLAGVVTRPAKPAGRGLKPEPNPVLKFAETNQLKVFLVDHKTDWDSIDATINSIMPDAVLVVGLGRIIPDSTLNLLPEKFINIHPSLLPKYRGPSPIEGAILDSANESGVSFIIVTKEMDAGPVISQTKVDIGNLNAVDAANKLSTTAATLCPDVIISYLDRRLMPTPQVDAQASYTHIITKADGSSDINDNPFELYRKIMAYNPWPGVTVTLGKMKVKLLKAKMAGDVLCITEVQPENKRAMSGADFKRGYQHLLTKLPQSVKLDKEL